MNYEDFEIALKNALGLTHPLEWYCTDDATKKFNEISKDIYLDFCKYFSNLDVLESNKAFLGETEYEKGEQEIKESFTKKVASNSFMTVLDFFIDFINKLNDKYLTDDIVRNTAVSLMTNIYSKNFDNKKVSPNLELKPYVVDDDPTVKFIKKLNFSVSDDETFQYVLSKIKDGILKSDDERLYDPSLFASQFSKININKINELIYKQNKSEIDKAIKKQNKEKAKNDPLELDESLGLNKKHKKKRT